MGQNTMCTFPFNINIMQNNIFAAARFFQYLRSLPLKQEVFLSAASHIKGLNRSRSSVRGHLNASRRDVWEQAEGSAGVRGVGDPAAARGRTGADARADPPERRADPRAEEARHRQRVRG